jgi:hypothetical protein
VSFRLMSSFRPLSLLIELFRLHLSKELAEKEACATHFMDTEPLSEESGEMCSEGILGEISGLTMEPSSEEPGVKSGLLRMPSAMQVAPVYGSYCGRLHGSHRVVTTNAMLVDREFTCAKRVMKSASETTYNDGG